MAARNEMGSGPDSSLRAMIRRHQLAVFFVGSVALRICTIRQWNRPGLPLTRRRNRIHLSSTESRLLDAKDCAMHWALITSAPDTIGPCPCRC